MSTAGVFWCIEMRKGSLGVIYIRTKHDNPNEFERVQLELDITVKADYFIVGIDGDKNPDLTRCLNMGIQSCKTAGAEFIHWAHPDFHYDDPKWFSTLREILEAYPEILKVCASNSRDEIGPWRIGQEQSWLMRANDFDSFPWLYFNEQFKGIGGYEDWYQSYQILGHGYVLCITPEVTVHHLGASSRTKHDTTKDQWFNHDVFCRLTEFPKAIEPHLPEFFGYFLTVKQTQYRLQTMSPVLAQNLKLDL